MARLRDKERAIALRKQGKSYSQIKTIIGVGKGTLSEWLGKYPLPESRIRELRDWNEKRIEHYRETRRRKRETLLADVYKTQKKKIFPLGKRDVFLAGLFLYWGEGGKTKPAELILSNTNPAVILAFIEWVGATWGIGRKDLRVRLHLYKDMDTTAEVSFWSKTLSISRRNFRKPHIKNSRLSGLTYRKGFGHGTCNIVLANATVAREILQGLRAIEDHFMGQ